jgi:hypothetical protein
MLSRRTQLVCFILLACSSAVLDVIVAARMSITYDERMHLEYGERILRMQPDRGPRLDSMMPVSALNAVPVVFASYLDAHNLFPRLSALLKKSRLTRIPSVLATVALNVLVYLWAYDLYGAEAALAAGLLCMLSPNLIAHGTLVTTDLFHALGVVGSLYCFRLFLLQPTIGRAFVGAFALALAQLTKPFAILLYGVVALALAFALFRRNSLGPLTPKRVLVFAVIAAVAFVLTINVAYSFDRTFTALNSYHLQSRFLTRAQHLAFINRVPLPLPYPVLQGLDLTKLHEENGQCCGGIYLLGELRDITDKDFRPFKDYFLVAWAFKEPIALQILFVGGLLWVARNRTLNDFVFGEGLLLGAAAILILWASFFNKIQLGIRHILPALAIEIVIAAACFSHFSSKPKMLKAALATLILWLFISVASYYPHMIPYMNEWVSDRRFSYKLLADSNLDWGQDSYVVYEFITKYPDVVLEPQVLMPGRILVSANHLTGVAPWSLRKIWLEKSYQPIAQVGYAHFLFVVPAKDASPVP